MNTEYEAGVPIIAAVIDGIVKVWAEFGKGTANGANALHQEGVDIAEEMSEYYQYNVEWEAFKSKVKNLQDFTTDVDKAVKAKEKRRDETSTQTIAQNFVGKLRHCTAWGCNPEKTWGEYHA